MKKPVVLRIFKGDQLQGVKQFTDAQIVIGRPGEVQVPLEGDNVSMIHAAIEERDGSYFVADLGSEAGTFKNGEQVLDVALESGDIVQVGDYRIEFHVGAPKPKAAPGAEATAPAPVAAQPPATPKIDPAPAPPVVEAKPLEKSAETPVEKPQEKPQEKVVEAPAAPAQAGSSFGLGKAPVQPARTTADPIPVALNPLAGPGVTAGTLPSKKVGTTRKPLEKKTKKGRRTFAPPSKHANIRDFVKPTKGTIVEILVAWRERIIATYHFSQKKVVTMGSKPDCDVMLPGFATKARKIPLVKIDASATVLVTGEMTGELIRGQTSSPFIELVRQNRMVKTGPSYAINLEQGEMVRIDCGEQVSVIIRYVSEAPKPMVAPLLDFTTSEFTGIVLSLAIVLSFWLYLFLYETPRGLQEDTIQEPLRTALIITPPTPPPVAPPAAPVEQVPQPTPPPQVAKATPAPTKVQVPDRAQQAKPQQSAQNLTTKNDPGKSANAAPNDKKGPRQLTSPKQGGSIKTTDQKAAQAQSVKKDVSKSGIFSVFGGGGAQDQLAQGTSGSGELVGMADAATGRAGMNESRSGQGLGTNVKDTGAGGTGKALVGISGGVDTIGRGSGKSGAGVGGIGSKAGTRIVTESGAESVQGTIDREAIRRVILANLKTIRSCYENQLNRYPDLSGKLVLSWDIGERGKVVGTRVKSNELGNNLVPECILNRLKTWKFPEPPANQVVEVEAYPFFFAN